MTITKYQDIDIGNINSIVDEITIDKKNIDTKYQDIEEQINNIKKYKKIWLLVCVGGNLRIHIERHAKIAGNPPVP